MVEGKDLAAIAMTGSWRSGARAALEGRPRGICEQRPSGAEVAPEEHPAERHISGVFMAPQRRPSSVRGAPERRPVRSLAPLGRPRAVRLLRAAPGTCPTPSS